MLYHITMTHVPENCRKVNALGRRMEKQGYRPPKGLKIHYWCAAVGDHKDFLLVETDDPKALEEFWQPWKHLLDQIVTPVYSELERWR